MSDLAPTGTMIVSVREVAVLARQIMLALEVPPAAVTDAARLLAELEIQDRQGIRYMASIRHAPASLVAGRLQVIEENPAVTVLDAAGGSGLIVGPTLLDLPSAQAKLHGAGALICRNVTSLAVLPCLVEQGRRRGVSTFVAVAPRGGFEQERLAPILTRFAPATVDIVNASSTDVADVFLRVEAAIRELRGRDRADSGSSAIAGAMRAGCVTLRWPELSEPGDVLIACCAPPSKTLALNTTGLWSRNGGYDWIEMGDALVAPDAAETRAMTEGIPVDRKLWRDLMDFSQKALVPNSERSRRDGGPYSGAGTWQTESIE